MKIKTSELIGPALDWAVAKCEGLDFDILTSPLTIALADKTVFGTRRVLDPLEGHDNNYHPSSNWSQGGPIIAREGINIQVDVTKTGQWHAKLARPSSIDPRRYCGHFGPTPLIAAMRCYVASKLGDKVEIPDELTRR